MKVKEVFAKAVLTRTAISGFDYCLNPYVGCEHGCRYCYAHFMKRFTGHLEPWGEFIDVKVNAPARLKHQLKRAKPGVVAIGTVTDPYQPLERTYQITRKCLEVLLEKDFSVNLLTRSPLCLRDIDLIKQFRTVEVGLSVTTHDETMRKLFEPRSPSIVSRLQALERLQKAGIRTYAFIGPMLPLKPDLLANMLMGRVEEVWIDRMNYLNRVKRLYHQRGLDAYLTNDYFYRVSRELKERLGEQGIPVTVLF